MSMEIFISKPFEINNDHTNFKLLLPPKQLILKLTNESFHFKWIFASS